MRTPIRLLLASAVATGVVVLGGTAANAATPAAAGASRATAGAASASSCAADVIIGITSSRYVFMWDHVTWFHDGPGGTMTGHVDRQTQIGSTISYGADISLNDLVASVKASVSHSATRSVTTTVGHTYTHPVPANKFGNLKYGAWGYSVSWVKEYRHSNCTISVLGRGTGTVATSATGWFYYNTNT